MKKKLGALVLTLASLVISACASSSASSKPTSPATDPGETWSKAGPSALSRPAKAPAVHTASLASR